jgi:hypothetical protein
MNNPTYIDKLEAEQLTGKSNSTLRRLIEQVKNNDEQFNEHPVLKTEEYAKGKIKYLINKDYLIDRFALRKDLLEKHDTKLNSSNEQVVNSSMNKSNEQVQNTENEHVHKQSIEQVNEHVHKLYDERIEDIKSELYRKDRELENKQETINRLMDTNDNLLNKFFALDKKYQQLLSGNSIKELSESGYIHDVNSSEEVISPVEQETEEPEEKSAPVQQKVKQELKETKENQKKSKETNQKQRKSSKISDKAFIIGFAIGIPIICLAVYLLENPSAINTFLKNIGF